MMKSIETITPFPEELKSVKDACVAIALVARLFYQRMFSIRGVFSLTLRLPDARRLKTASKFPNMVNTTSYVDTTGNFASSSGHLSLFLHYGRPNQSQHGFKSYFSARNRLAEERPHWILLS